MENKKYLCDLSLMAEGCTFGQMWLTKEEYEIVKRVTDTRNWENLDAETWCGSFYISCEELDAKQT